MHIQSLIWFQASHLHIKVKWLFDLKHTDGNTALLESLFLKGDAKWRGVGLSVVWSVTGSCFHFCLLTLVSTYETNNNNQHNPSFSHWLSCYLLCWRVEARIRNGHIFGKELKCNVRLSYNIVLLCQVVYLQQVSLIFCVTATHFRVAGVACNPGLFVVESERTKSWIF